MQSCWELGLWGGTSQSINSILENKNSKVTTTKKQEARYKLFGGGEGKILDRIGRIVLSENVEFE